MIKVSKKELKQLFLKIKDDKELGFQELYTKYNKLVYAIAFSILRNKEDSLDVTQSIFAKIYKLEKDKLPNKKEASWLYTVTKNEAITYLRKKKNNVLIEDLYELEDDNNEINKLIDRISYNNLIKKLNKKEKEILSLKILSNLSFKEISKLTDEPVGTVKWRYYKSLSSLKIVLGNFIISITTLVIALRIRLYRTKNEEKVENKENENLEEKPVEEDRNELLNSEEQKLDTKEEAEQQQIQNTETTQETVIIDDAQFINYVEIGFFATSIIFMLSTIIILIRNHLKNKLSKISKKS